jgi:transposase-like protein
MSEMVDIDRLFNGRHFDREVIVLCVLWYLRYKLSLRDLVEIMAERGLSLAHTYGHALGQTLRAGVHQALEPVCEIRRSFMES